MTAPSLAAGQAMPVTVPADTTAVDSIAADTIPAVWGVTIEAPAPYPAIPEPDTSMSWLIGGLLLCFVIVAIRFKNNGKYIVSLWKDITEVRERRNAFDDTVRETSFLVLLNIFWIAGAAILLGCVVCRATDTWNLPQTVLHSSLPTAGLYTLMMFFAYWMVGNVFSDSTHTSLWVRGYAATNGILSVFLFPVALLTLCYPSEITTMLTIAAAGYILSKILFLYKGFRIFFSQGSSWVLFLYYLCSLEIVPLVLAYAGALELDRIR